MKTDLRRLSFILLAAFALTTPVFGAGPEKDKPVEKAPSGTPSPEWLAKAKAAYPLETCVVSDEQLGDDAYNYVHKEAGRPDRLVRFCCAPCVDDFKKDPTAYLKKIDDAAKAKAEKSK
jgi:hypothetical protein